MRRTVNASHVRCRTRRIRPNGEAGKLLAIALTAFTGCSSCSRETIHYELGVISVKWIPDGHDPMLPYRVAARFASVGRRKRFTARSPILHV